MHYSIMKCGIALASLHRCLSFASSLSPPGESNETTLRSNGYSNIAYFTNWSIYGRNFHPAQLPADELSQVLYAFVNLHADGTVYPGDPYADLEKHYPGDSWSEPGNNAYGCIKQLYLLKQRNRHLKVSLSIGGWNWSKNFPAAAASIKTRATFANTSVTLMKDWGFDGIDIDWEYPSDESDAVNMVKLLKSVRRELDSYSSRRANGHHFVLSIAAPAAPSNFNLLKLRALSEIVDYVNLMAYDYAGSWSNTSCLNSNLYDNAAIANATPFNTDEAIRSYIAAGVPAKKIILGQPTYGRSFEQTDGLGKKYLGIGEGSWENGVWDYKVLPKPGAVVKYDKTAMGSYSYDSASLELIAYDSPEATRSKVSYIKQIGLGGSMFWEASGDRTDNESLISTSLKALGGIERTRNCLDYPNSKYDNIRNGMTSVKFVQVQSLTHQYRGKLKNDPEGSQKEA